jgi:hypothetical protein
MSFRLPPDKAFARAGPFLAAFGRVIAGALCGVVVAGLVGNSRELSPASMQAVAAGCGWGLTGVAGWALVLRFPAKKGSARDVLRRIALMSLTAGSVFVPAGIAFSSGHSAAMTAEQVAAKAAVATVLAALALAGPAVSALRRLRRSPTATALVFPLLAPLVRGMRWRRWAQPRRLRRPAGAGSAATGTGSKGERVPGSSGGSGV